MLGVPDKYRAFALMALGSLIFTTSDLIVKGLVDGRGFSANNMVMLRMASTGCICPILIWHQKIPTPTPDEVYLIKMLLARGALAVLGMYTFTNSLKYLPLVDSITLWQITPIFTGVLSYAFLRQSLTYTDMAAALVSFAGAVFVIRPAAIFGDDSINDQPGRMYGALFMLACITGDATFKIMTRKIGEAAHALVFVYTTALSGLCMGVACLIFIPSEREGFDHFDAAALCSFAIVTICGGTAQYCYALALQGGNVGKTALFCYIAVPYSMLLSWLVHGDGLTWLSEVGTCMILGSAVVVALGEGDHGDTDEKEVEERSNQESATHDYVSIPQETPHAAQRPDV